MRPAAPAALIGRKRDGGELDHDELAALVEGYLHGEVSEGQMAALLMAGVLNGFTRGEARALTAILVDSGDVLDLSGLEPTVDKHSTGGVSDGTTLLVAPLLAACGVHVVKLAGRGLGHTGGTLDKLESVPGVRVELDEAELRDVAGRVGCVVAAHTDRLVPADRALYALRDVTATVASPALVASSVMSKKLAAGAESIVLDVKAGDGAFMPSVSEAVELAELCVEIGADAGRRCRALVTAMDQPLGRAVGNALEVAEAVELLGSEPVGRLADLAVDLAGEGLSLARGIDPSSVGEEVHHAWRSGAALDRLARMLAAQGGDPRVCEHPWEVLPTAPVTRDVHAPTAGTVRRVPARCLGETAGDLGAGRARARDEIDPAVGVRLEVEVGATVEPGDVLARVHARRPADAEAAVQRLEGCIDIGPGLDPGPTVLQRIGHARQAG